MRNILVDLGVLLTLLLSIISGTYLIGKIDGRLTAVEMDKDYSSFKKERGEALSEIIRIRTEAINEMKKNEKQTIDFLNAINKRIDELEELIEYKTREFEKNKVPQGTVAAFALFTCPNGWLEFKDGAGRVILGVGSGKGLTERKKIFEIGGQELVTLTEPQMPSHYHQIPSRGNSGAEVVFAVQASSKGEYNGDYARQTDSKGGNQPHENMPPFITLLFCQKG